MLITIRYETIYLVDGLNCGYFVIRNVVIFVIGNVVKVWLVFVIRYVIRLG